MTVHRVSYAPSVTMTEVVLYDVFLSYGSRDRSLVEQLANALRVRGFRPFLDRWYLVPGQFWREALEQVLDNCRGVMVFIGPGEMGSWQKRETDLALDIQCRKPGFFVIPVLLPGCDPIGGFLAGNTWIDLRQGVDDTAAPDALACALNSQPAAAGPIELPDRGQVNLCPYRGLRYFREEDASLYFGREAAIQPLIAALERRRFVAVVGASGSGKSSLVRAGLLPALRRLQHPAREVVCFFPGDDPFAGLAASLMPLLEPELTETSRLIEAEKLARALCSGELTLTRVVARLLQNQLGTDRVLFIIDQWEELYALTHDDVVRQRFTDTVLTTTNSDQPVPIDVIMTLRGDFVGHALAHRRLSDALQDSQINLGPMIRSELARAVVQPAARVGLAFESGLVERLLNDVGTEPGNLPLLEFALQQLFEANKARVLTHEAYESIGLVQGAVTKQAEGLYARMSSSEQAATKKILLDAVRTSSSGEHTRRRAKFSELPEQMWQVARDLTSNRLLVSASDASGEQTFEICHEVLIHSWARLQSWLNEDREFLLWRDRFRALVEEWRHRPDDEGTQLRGGVLDEAARWRRDRGSDLSLDELTYIDQGNTARLDMVRSEETRREEELRQAAVLAHAQEKRLVEQVRAARWLKIALVAMAIGATMVVALIFRAESSRSRAELARTQAEELTGFMIYDLTERLRPLGRLDILEALNRKVDEYHSKTGLTEDGAEMNYSFAAINRGVVLFRQGNYAEALDAFQESRAVLERRVDQDPGNDHWLTNLSVCLEWIGMTHVAQERLNDALGSFKESHAIRERLVQLNPGSTTYQSSKAVSLNKIGEVLSAQGVLDEALSRFGEAQTVFRYLSSKEPESLDLQRELSVSAYEVGQVLVKQGKLDKALGLFGDSLTIREKLSGLNKSNPDSRSDLQEVLERIGEVLALQGNADEARIVYARARVLAEQLSMQLPTDSCWSEEAERLRSISQ